VACTPLRWKQSVLKLPIFRQAKKTPDGYTVADKPLLYSHFNDCLDRLGVATGFEQKLTSYCFRRGTGNAVDGAATTAVRDQVMRQNPNSAVFNGAYINERVRFDVQSAFLGRPSATGLLRVFTHMSLRRDPRAPIHVPDEVLEALPRDSEIEELERQREQLKAGTYRLKGREVEKEARRLNNMINAARTRRRNAISEAYRADYFRRRPTEDIERQNRGLREEEYIEPEVEHQIPERTQLVEVICTFPKDLSSKATLNRRVQAVDLMMALCHKRETPRRYRRQVMPHQQILIKEESSKPADLPLTCEKTQCPFCIGDEKGTSVNRLGVFTRPSSMWDHVDRKHLRGLPENDEISCRHPTCKSEGLILTSLMHFKNHVATVHGIYLRP